MAVTKNSSLFCLFSRIFDFTKGTTKICVKIPISNPKVILIRTLYPICKFLNGFDFIRIRSDRPADVDPRRMGNASIAFFSALSLRLIIVWSVTKYKSEPVIPANTGERNHDLIRDMISETSVSHKQIYQLNNNKKYYEQEKFTHATIADSPPFQDQFRHANEVPTTVAPTTAPTHACVVDTGIAVKVARSKKTAPPKRAAAIAIMKSDILELQ